jgi:hypothetical protein
MSFPKIKIVDLQKKFKMFSSMGWNPKQLSLCVYTVLEAQHCGKGQKASLGPVEEPKVNVMLWAGEQSAWSSQTEQFIN